MEERIEDREEPRRHLVEIKVDNHPYRVSAGRHLVSEIKHLAGVPEAFELDEDIHGKLTPIDQAGSVTIKGGETFVSHPRDGSSS
jgi:hypothetical protein